MGALGKLELLILELQQVTDEFIHKARINDKLIALYDGVIEKQP